MLTFRLRKACMIGTYYLFPAGSLFYSFIICYLSGEYSS